MKLSLKTSIVLGIIWISIVCMHCFASQSYDCVSADKIKLSSPENGSTLSKSSPVILKWNEFSTVFFIVTIYLNNQLLHTSENISGTTTEYTIPIQLKEGNTYEWEVSRLVGTNTSDRWKFTILNTVLPAPQLLSPQKASIDQPLNTTFTWQKGAGSTDYRFQMAKTIDFSAFIKDSIVTQPALAIKNLAYKTLYYWRVRTQKKSDSSTWSDVWSFTTCTEPAVAPLLSSPADKAQNIPLDVYCSWNKDSSASSYSFQLALSQDFSPTKIIVETNKISNNTFHISGLKGLTTYYWRVNALHGDKTSAWSYIWSFTTQLANTSILDLGSVTSKQTPAQLTVFPSIASVQTDQKIVVSFKTASERTSLVATLYDWQGNSILTQPLTAIKQSTVFAYTTILDLHTSDMRYLSPGAYHIVLVEVFPGGKKNLARTIIGLRQ